MDHLGSSGDLVLEILLKTNRPPTEEERAVVQRSMVLTGAKLKVMQGRISDTVAHINGLKSQVPSETESELRRLREEEAANLMNFENHLRVLAPFRNLPEDVLREIFIACVAEEIPTLRHHTTPLPYVLAQISRGMRHVVLTTPIIWARMDIHIRQYHFGNLDEETYQGLARRVKEWFDCSGGLPLSVFIDDPSSFNYTVSKGGSDPVNILLDALFRYSARWREIQFISSCNYASPPLLRFVRLTIADVPILQSSTLCLHHILQPPVLSDISFLQTPTLRHVSLATSNVRNIPINWAVLTSVSLDGMSKDRCYSKYEIVQIFRQIKCLVSCNIVVRPTHSDDEIYLEEINLPFLESLRIVQNFDSSLSEAPSLLDLISAPILVELNIDSMFLELSLLNFVKKSPNILKLRVPYSEEDKSFVFITTLLHHCPFLTDLDLWPCNSDSGVRPPSGDANLFLRSFVEDGNASVTCPRLQDFTFMGKLDFSVETLRLFLEGKKSYITAPSIVPWKRVIIYIENMKTMESERYQRISELVLQKKAEGLHVKVSFEGIENEYVSSPP